MFLIPLLIIILIIWLLFQVFNNHHYYPQNPNNNNNNNAGYTLDRSLEILRERYARGEINSEEYQKIKRNLES